MDLRRLKHLVALADTRNFGRAAQRCHLSQSAFSRSVQAAEEEFGLQLFDRGNLEVTCTAAGAFVIERARKLLFASRCLERDVDLYRDRLIGDLSFGVGPYVAAALLPRLLIELRARFPGVNARVTVNNTEYLSQHLRAEELDFFVADLRNIETSPDFAVEGIGHLAASFYVRPSHPLLSGASPRFADLLPYGVASVRIPAAVQALLVQSLGLEPGSRFPLAVECDSVEVLKTLAQTTDAVAACPDQGVVAELAEGRLARLDVADFPTTYSDVGVVSLKGRTHSPIAEFAIDFLASLAGQRVPA